MRAHAALVVRRRGDRSVLTTMRSAPPLTLRRTGTAGETARVHLVGTAAAPLGGDELRLDIDVGPDAALELRSTGAQIALPHASGGPSTVHIGLNLAGSAVLHQEPTVLARGSLVHNNASAQLTHDARLVWRDLVVLGRHGEEPGRMVQRWNVTRAGRPVLRTTTTLVDPLLYRSPAIIGGATVLGTALVVSPGLTTESRVIGHRAAVHALSGAALVTVLGEDAVEVEHALTELTPTG
ncbi:urease accessory protein UreD [Allokutzneria oryzae]|uniref:Urease accessory protein UreD n=1 Tax=Allokutzneria oryzae TaxID=1378989 RepID=A0ABV5ZRJ5_9PSEU